MYIHEDKIQDSNEIVFYIVYLEPRYMDIRPCLKSFFQLIIQELERKGVHYMDSNNILFNNIMKMRFVYQAQIELDFNDYT